MCMEKIDLCRKIEEVCGLTAEEKADIIGLIRSQKKYGLVWEEKTEDVEARLQEELPVLMEVRERAIVSDDKDAPNHILIEGDNLEALTTLSYTHEGKVDVIYIDPPYNTGKKDFVYNDRYVDSEDEYRHSKWLSFMHKRLKLAKQLLSEGGVIFISIDDNEQAQLKLLCDEVFLGRNFLGQCVRKRRDSQANLSKNISPIHEYLFIYSKNNGVLLNKISANIDESSYKNPDNDPRGKYTTMPCTNKGGSVYIIKTPTGREISEEWRFKKETYESLMKDNRIVFPRKGDGKPRYKLFLSEKKEEGQLANTWLDNLPSNQEGTRELKDIFEDLLVFDNPKPIGLLTFCLQLASNKNSTILDFFAGSGTTLHATMQLNAEDGGRRKCILVTNNENNICEEVTYERNKRVIQGYTTPKGEAVEGLKGNNLRYYKTEFISRERTAENMRRLMDMATDMLCIRNNVYTEAQLAGKRVNRKVLRYFADERTRMLVVYREECIPQIVPLIAETPLGADKMKVYVFSAGNYAYRDDFEDVLDRVDPCPLPSAIYEAYKRVLPKRKPKMSGAVATEEGTRKREEI